MSTHKHIDAICIGITVLTLLLTVLFINGKALGIAVIASEEGNDEMFTANDQNAAWDTSGATRITLSDDGSTVSGNGAYVNGGDIYIVYAGKYVVSGELSDGTIRIEADGDDKIWLMLSGASIHCEDDAAIRVEQAGKVFMTLQDGTDNTLSSGAAFSAEAVSGGVDGTIYSRDDLTINGTGSLVVTAEYQHGIVCNDDFVVTGGTIDVTAVQDAIHANDSVRIKEATITLTAGDDGITVSNDDETAFLYVESGNLNIPSCYEGLEAIQITIAGGTLNISPFDDGINANGYGGSSVINITGGEITITNESGRDADGIDSNKDIFNSGGRLLISVGNNGGNCAIDYGSENGGICEISGGVVLACGSSGMAEGFDSSSTQGFLMYSTSAASGTAVTVKDAGGNELLSETVPYSFSSVLVSTPEMSVGDTCTLIIGETETEMTIDNSSGSGGFGGGQMPGGNGFGGGHGGFGGKGNGGMFGGRTNDPANENGNTQDQSAQTVMHTVNVLSTAYSAAQDQTDGTNPYNGQGGNSAPDPTGNKGADGMQPPGMPDGANGGTPPDFPQGGMNGGGSQPEFPQDGTTDDGTQPDTSKGEPNGDSARPDDPQGGMFGGGMNGGGMQPDAPQDNGNFGGNMGNMQDQGNTSQTTNAGTPISAETLLLLGISSVVLLCGCIIAFLYKRR